MKSIDLELGETDRDAAPLDVLGQSGQNTPDGELLNSADSADWDSLVATLPEPFADALSLGGPVTLILALMSVVALAIILFKFVQLFIERSRGRRLIAKALQRWHQGDTQGAMNLLANSHRGVARLVRVAMQGKESPNAPDALVREEVQRLADVDIQSLRSHLRTLEVIGNLSPLLGLFGTVLGMIEAFRQMEAAGANVDPSVLSGGIWQALLTTGVGLAVAIPTVLAFQYLDRRAERHAQRIENTVTQVFTAQLHRPDAPSSDSRSLNGNSRAS